MLKMINNSLRSRKDTFYKMAKFSRQIEMMVYRFIMSLLVGFFLGTYIITHTNQSTVKTLEKFVCSNSLDHRSPREVSEMLKRSSKKSHVQEGVLYVGVMSMQRNLNSRVAAMIDTWARHPNVRVEIFANSNGSLDASTGQVTILQNGARIISLPSVADVSYPPQKKSFSMLKYIHDNHLNKFNWFLRADDDAYFKIEELIQFLSKVNSSKPYFIGHPGYGKHADDYLFGENYCMGGTGVFLSRETLRKVGPKLSECLQQMYTEHEDIELGRCVRKVTGISCTNAWETSSIFYQNFRGKGSYEDNIDDISERKRAGALVFHANKEPKYQHKLHHLILSDQINLLLRKITKLETETKKMLSLLVMRKFDDKAWNAHAGYVWDAITQRSMYSATSQLVRSIPATVKDAAVQSVFYTVAELRKRHEVLSSHIDEIVIVNTRYYANPFTSADMITKLKVRIIKQKTKHTIYLNNIYFRRSFPDSVVYLNEPYPIDKEFIKQKAEQQKSMAAAATEIEVGSSERINFIMALSGRPGNLERFLKNFEEAFLSLNGNVSLTIVYYPEKPHSQTENLNQVIDADNKVVHSLNVSHVMTDIDLVQAMVNSLVQRYPKTFIKMITVKNGLSFSRGAGLQIGAKNILRDEILFFCDVDLVFGPEILFHIRRSTIKGTQVYYPTFFSQYDPDIVYSYQDPPDTSFYYEEIAGFWRAFSYGMVAIYNSDFLNTGGFDLSIRGWGLEDLRLCDAILRKAKLQVFKANEPAMVHIYHDKDCPADLSREQRQSCHKSRAQHFGPQTLMYYLWQREKDGDDEGEEENDPKVEVDNRSLNSPSIPN